MVSQIRDVLERYRSGGGRVEIEMFDGSGHFPAADAADRFPRRVLQVPRLHSRITSASTYSSSPNG
jgi:hypothetical protein